MMYCLSTRRSYIGNPIQCTLQDIWVARYALVNFRNLRFRVRFIQNTSPDLLAIVRNSSPWKIKQPIKYLIIHVCCIKPLQGKLWSQLVQESLILTLSVNALRQDKWPKSIVHRLTDCKSWHVLWFLKELKVNVKVQ